ncbi:SET domain-containing protein [Sediminibacter sp. Hel_I_10]|uniref:SET domain-containing protein n=1 Tax=Sediminibacter sp. Hel_I_10 TaxID=1392490 RepID=UPI0004786CF0|nr:SET domain-containing protein [Sediminibacter sp. Hel_I_10]
MIHPKTEVQYINDDVGYGLVATEFIPAGTIKWVLDPLDREFTPSQISNLPPNTQEILDIYSYRNSKGNHVLCWDDGKYVNHSFKSNCLTTAYDFEIAVRDIQPGEQLTDDYGYLNISEPFKGIDEGTERKVVYPDDLVNFHAVWDKQLNAVFGHIVTLDQPLKKWVSSTIWKKIQDITVGKTKMDSILKNYFNSTSKV